MEAGSSQSEVEPWENVAHVRLSRVQRTRLDPKPFALRLQPSYTSDCSLRASLAVWKRFVARERSISSIVLRIRVGTAPFPLHTSFTPSVKTTMSQQVAASPVKRVTASITPHRSEAIVRVRANAMAFSALLILTWLLPVRTLSSRAL